MYSALQYGCCLNGMASIQIGTFDYTQLGFQFLDFQLKSFVDPKPVELGESAIYQKFCLNKLV